MRFSSLLLTCAASVLLLSGCGTAVSSQWRSDALQRFNTAISAGAEAFAPDETDNIRQTLSLADRYYNADMIEDADQFYQLSSQKCQLLYRSLLLNRRADAASLTLGTEQDNQGEVSEISIEHISHGNNELTTYPEDLMPTVAVTNSSTTEPRSPRPHNIRAISSSPRFAKSSITTIYLTFDDGPSRLTLPIAAYLKSVGVQATFFALGSNIKGREKAITDTLAMGHHVGSHTLSHNLHRLKASFAGKSSEVKLTADMIDQLGGDGKMVRIPYGASDKTIISHVADEGAQIFDWDINSNDSTQRGVKNHLYIEKTVLNQLKNSTKKHVILLFHDGAGHNSTLTALRDLIPRLKQEGYRFGLLSRTETVVRTTEKRHLVQ
jgi:peptidoglycan/xylan/chitin deacetylase (PgdA/CDA1 family)